MGTTWNGGLGSGLLSSRRSGFTYSRDYTLRGVTERAERPIVNIETARNQAIQAARELYYGEAVIEKLKAATTLRQLDRILMEARAAM